MWLFLSTFLVAWPDPVPSLNVYSIYNGLLIEWTKPHRYMQLLYSLRCQQLSWTHNKVKVISNSIDKKYRADRQAFKGALYLNLGIAEG